MLKHLKFLQKNKAAATPGKDAKLSKVRRSVRWQAALALLTVVLTVVIVFTMTAAWYTNVVQTSGLVIQAESWGFDGQITVNNTAVTAAPGDEGSIDMQATNASAGISAVSVGVSKARMSQEMQKRLYFYADTQAKRNGEIMDRVYLNTQDSYTYTLFGGQTLTLTEELHTDVQLKWQWVYDVLGYYVLGTWSSQRNSLTAVEYLRPIEYNYDEATTTFRQNGDTVTMELQTVDGKTSVEDFLVQLSKTDGYPGQIDPTQKLGSGYYPVAVDKDGYGVYAYICTYSDIVMATQFDTQLAKTALENEKNGVAGERYEAQLIISAQKNDENIVSVSTLAGIQDAMTLAPGTVVQLTEDMSLQSTEQLVIPENTSLTLDLNGHTITTASTDRAINARPGSNLTLMNGSLAGTGSGWGVYAEGAQVDCYRVTVDGFAYGVRIGDDTKGNTLDSQVRLAECQIHATSGAVFINGNGTLSPQDTQLIIENCDLSSESYVICSNGTATGTGKWGTDIQIHHSVLTSNPAKVSAAIYHPQKNSTLTVYDSTVSGYTAMAIKGGTVRVLGSTVTGKGAQQSPGSNNSGFSDTGDAIYIEANYGYNILLTIDSATVGEETRQSVITGEQGYALQVWEKDAENVTVRIYNGDFSHEQRKVHIASGSAQTENAGIYAVRAQ